jgi:hypothetical protein
MPQIARMIMDKPCHLLAAAGGEARAALLEAAECPLRSTLQRIALPTGAAPSSDAPSLVRRRVDFAAELRLPCEFARA